ncbi:NADH-quinone oxidoreductase subunit NuoE [Chloroflexota bacterium]
MAESSDKSRLLHSLKEAQHERGYLSGEVITQTAEGLDVCLGDAYGVATFYSFLATEPKGRNVIRVCRSIPCDLKNYRAIVGMLEKELGIKPGETTEDGVFSLELTNCIGACDKAPAMMINDMIYEELNAERIKQILAEYR